MSELLGYSKELIITTFPYGVNLLVLHTAINFFICASFELKFKYVVSLSVSVLYLIVPQKR